MKSLGYSKTILAAALALGFLGTIRAADVTGQWKAAFEIEQIGLLKYTYDLKQDGDKITGKIIREQDDQKTTIELKDGKIKGDEISFVEPLTVQDQEIRIEYSGKVTGDELKLTRKVGDFGTTDIVARRGKETAPPSAIAVAGKWQAEFDSQVGHQKYIYEFKLDGDKLTGKATRELNDEKTTTDIKGKVTGGDISFTEPLKVQDQDIDIDYTGKISADEIKLTRKVGDFATTEIVAKRMKE